MQIPHTALGADTLRSLIEEYITREGTDYGRESELEQKVARVMAQLEKGKAHITFDAETESCTLITTQRLEKKVAAGDDPSFELDAGNQERADSDVIYDQDT